MSHLDEEDELPLIWPCLIQKAYAKAFGNYEKILFQDLSSIMSALTGAPCQRIIADGSKEMFETLESALNSKFFIAACAKDTKIGKSEVNPIGVQSGYSYPITASWPGSKYRLLNPFNSKIKGFEFNSENGFFVMNAKDLANNFKEILVCKVHHGYHYEACPIMTK